MNLKRYSVALIASLSLASSLAFAGPTHSQSRLEGQSWKDSLTSYMKEHKHIHLKKGLGLMSVAVDPSAYSKATQVDKADLTSVPVWDINLINDTFQKGRDVRFLDDPSHPNFLRRSTWLYPDDGCFARAALFNQHSEAWNKARPGKIFIFGDLNVDTANSTSGSVSWWYHVAPIISDGANVYVLDAALNPKAPTPLNDWIAMMTKDPTSVTISVCNGYSYAPSSPCLGATDTEDASATEDQGYYLDAEWSRLEELGRNPNVELGDTPPWAVVPPTTTKP